MKRQSWQDQLKELLDALSAQNTVADWQASRSDTGQMPDSQPLWAQQLLDQHWTQEHGIGWRWRLCMFEDFHKSEIGIEDYAKAIVRSEKKAVRDANASRHVSTVRSYLSSGRRRLTPVQCNAIEKLLVDWCGPDAIHYFSADIRSLTALQDWAKELRPQRPVSGEFDLGPISDCHLFFDDPTRRLLRQDLRDFLEVEKSETSKVSRRPVFIVHSEFVREMHSHLRHLLLEFHAERRDVRRIIVIDGRTANPETLYKRVTSGAHKGDSLRVPEMSAEIISELSQRPALVIFVNFEPVLLGLERASISGACRNLGTHDLIARVAQGVAMTDTRIILSVSQPLGNVHASYIHKSAPFLGVSHMSKKLMRVIGEMTRHSEMKGRDRDIRRAIETAQRIPGDTHLNVLEYVARAGACNSDAVAAAISSGTIDYFTALLLDDVKKKCVSKDIVVGAKFMILLSAALAEDRIERRTLARVLKVVWRQSLTDEEIERSACLLCDELKTLLFIDRFPDDSDDDGNDIVTVDLEPTFRNSILRTIEDGVFPSSMPILSPDVIRDVRRVIAGEAYKKFKRTKKARPDAAVDEPRIIRYAILAIFQYLASIQKDGELYSRMPAKMLAPPSRLRRQPGSQEHIETTAQQDQHSLLEAYKILVELEDSGGQGNYALSRSHVGMQIKLQLWLLFQNTGRSRPSTGARHRGYLGPAALPPTRLIELSTSQNLNMLTSLAVAAFGLDLNDYGESVIGAAERYVIHLKRIGTWSIEKGETRLQRVKFQKLQIDLLVRRGNISAAESYCRDCLAESGYYDFRAIGTDFDAIELDGGIQIPSVQELESSDDDVASFAIWSRLLGRLGVVLSYSGQRRSAEAVAAFELAFRLDRAFQSHAPKDDHAAKSPAFFGLSSRTFFRHSCLTVDSRRAARRLLAAANARVESSDSVERDTRWPELMGFNEELRRLRAYMVAPKGSSDGPMKTIERAIDMAYLALLEATDIGGKSVYSHDRQENRLHWLSTWSQTALDQISMLKAVRRDLEGERLLGLDWARLYNAQMIIAVYGVAAFARQFRKRELQPENAARPSVSLDEYRKLAACGVQAITTLKHLLGTTKAARSARPLDHIEIQIAEVLLLAAELFIDAFSIDSRWEKSSEPRRKKIQLLATQFRELQASVITHSFFKHERVVEQAGKMSDTLFEKFAGIGPVA